MKASQISRVLASSHEITNKPLMRKTTKTVTKVPNYDAKTNTSDVEKQQQQLFRGQTFEDEANNMQLNKENTQLTK